jgi:hypothetical protein
MDTDDDASGSLSKRPRGGRQQVKADEDRPAIQESSSPPPAEDVKEVTTGVKTIDLNHEDSVVSSPTSESPPTTLSTAADPSQIPIPDTDSVDGEEEEDNNAKKGVSLDESSTDEKVEENAEKDTSSEVTLEGAKTNTTVEIDTSKGDDSVESKPSPSKPKAKSIPAGSSDTANSLLLPELQDQETEKMVDGLTS